VALILPKLFNSDISVAQSKSFSVPRKAIGNDRERERAMLC